MQPEVTFEVEICFRIRDGRMCRGTIYRSGTPEVVRCTSCGSSNPGMIFIPKTLLDSAEAERARLEKALIEQEARNTKLDRKNQELSKTNTRLNKLTQRHPESTT